MTETANRAAWLKLEIKRITNTTLRGTFSNHGDRDFWVGRVKNLNSELNALEQGGISSRKQSRK